MTIYLQWKWIEKTETFLLLLHFDADSSTKSKNLRIEPKLFWSSESLKDEELKKLSDGYYFPEYLKDKVKAVMGAFGDTSTIKVRNVITWAPTHVEIGILSELLCYANILNGLKKEQRRTLRTGLQFWVEEEIKEFMMEADKINREGNDEKLQEYVARYRENAESLIKTFRGEKLLRKMLNNRVYLFGLEDDFKEKKLDDLYCFELCPEYIDYLKKVLEPFR